MALHGEIKVGSEIIGEWVARRLESLEKDRDTYIYACSLMMADGTNWAGQVTHNYSAGAVSLAAKVMLNALVHMKTQEKVK